MLPDHFRDNRISQDVENFYHYDKHGMLAEKLQQDAGMVFVPELVALLDNLERELNAGQVSESSLQWLAQCGLTPEQMKNQIEPEYTPERKIHLYHCDHRGLPVQIGLAE